ncbi:MAG: lamin tail domain-containing protein, partial [Deltaproteobacteria bacterium]|nr:lamin tail domain-containing protein [Deltaproteobacteria bacterium]
AWVDEQGETDDWLEIVNLGNAEVTMTGFTLTDSSGSHPLPAVILSPGGRVLLWADDDPAQGVLHLPFKLSAAGETLILRDAQGATLDHVSFPPLGVNETYARFPDGDDFALCRFATPKRDNGAQCGPPPPAELPQEITFAPYTWPVPFPELPVPLALSELALKPAAFIEVVNTTASDVDLSAYTLSVAPHAPGIAWPDIASSVTLAWPVASAAPGEHVNVPVDAGAVAAIAGNSEFEGVVTLWDNLTLAPVDRADFMAWPDNAALARAPGSGLWRFCATSTPAAANDACDALASRPIGDRLRHLYTPGDFAALAFGDYGLGNESVKFVIDMQAGDVVHLLSSAAWDLHYTFVREEIDGDPHLDRCDPTEAAIFRQGWGQFSQEQYIEVDTRRYLLGTLEHHVGADLYTVEFTTGDRISSAQMKRAFFGVTAHTDEPSLWALRPQASDQIERMREIEGEVPIVDPNAPFRGVTVQLLNAGVAYGTLMFVPIQDLAGVALGPQVIVVTDQVPNDIPLVGGLITEAFQTPLAHVNVLSRNRGTPNLAVKDARNDPRVAPYLACTTCQSASELVRLEVTTGDFEMRPATFEEAEAFWQSQQTGPLQTPAIDTSVRGVQPLSGKGLTDLPSLGGKAAQLAELAYIDSARALCPGPLPLPSNAFAIPVVHSWEHYAASGAAALLATSEAEAQFRADPIYRAQKLAEVRTLVLAHPVDAALLTEIESHIAATFGAARLRFRSSSNTEDLPNFSGAGLYTSVSGALGDAERPIAGALRTVWASLYNARAYDERTYFNVDPSTVAMGVLVHEATLSEAANGIGISRNILDPIRGDIYYFNAQVGEAGVANPAPGVTTSQLIYRWGRTPRVIFHALSNLPGGGEVLSPEEIDETACVLRVIHDHFAPILNPTGENRWFAMDIEFKRLGVSRALLVKQARPYSFGNAEVPADCREF